MAYRHATRSYYFIDEKRRGVALARGDDGSAEMLNRSEGSAASPESLALEPAAGYVYWSDAAGNINMLRSREERGEAPAAGRTHRPAQYVGTVVAAAPGNKPHLIAVSPQYG